MLIGLQYVHKLQLSIVIIIANCYKLQLSIVTIIKYEWFLLDLIDYGKKIPIHFDMHYLNNAWLSYRFSKYYLSVYPKPTLALKGIQPI